MKLVARSTWTLGGVLLVAACAQGAATGGDAVDEDPSTGQLDAGQARRDAGTPRPDSSAPAPSAMDAGDTPPAPERDAASGSSDTPDAGPPPPPDRDADVKPPEPDGCAEICNTSLENDAKSCATPVTIGRKAALADDFIYNGDSRGDGNKQDLTFINCADGNADNFFRIYLYKGDRITMRLSTAEYDPVLVLTQGACTAPVAAACRDQGLDGESELMTVAIEEDGWHHVVTDGPFGSTAPEGQGRYTLSVAVDNSRSAAPGQCQCP